MIRTAPPPQSLVVGVFLFLLAAVAAVAPLPPLLRSLGIVVASYLAFGMGGMPYAYVTALLTPPIGLLGGDAEWLVLLPVVMSSNLLAMLGLEYGWRWAALAVSPLLLAAPPLVTWTLSNRALFQVDLPWQPNGGIWVLLHLLVGLAGVLTAIMLERRRLREDARATRETGEREPA